MLLSIIKLVLCISQRVYTLDLLILYKKNPSSKFMVRLIDFI